MARRQVAASPQQCAEGSQCTGCSFLHDTFVFVAAASTQPDLDVFRCEG